jgi:hypothetical protein
MTVQRERLHRLALEALYELAGYHERRGTGSGRPARRQVSWAGARKRTGS